MTYHTHTEFPTAYQYDYQPPEPDTYMEPGCDAAVTIYAVMLGGRNVISLLSGQQIQEMEQEILEHELGMAADHIDARADAEYDLRREITA